MHSQDATNISSLHEMPAPTFFRARLSQHYRAPASACGKAWSPTKNVLRARYPPSGLVEGLVSCRVEIEQSVSLTARQIVRRGFAGPYRSGQSWAWCVLFWGLGAMPDGRGPPRVSRGFQFGADLFFSLGNPITESHDGQRLSCLSASGTFLVRLAFAEIKSWLPEMRPAASCV